MKTSKSNHVIKACILAAALLPATVTAEELNYTDLTGEAASADALISALNISVRGIGSGCGSYQKEMTRLTRGVGSIPTKAEDVPALKTMKTAGVSATFGINSADLTTDAQQQLDTVAQALNSQSLANQCFQIAGHTCDLGDDSYNMDLSKRRADAVKSYLVAQGIDGERLVTTGFGETSPLLENNSESARTKNRRVDLGALAPASSTF